MEIVAVDAAPVLSCTHFHYDSCIVHRAGVRKNHDIEAHSGRMEACLVMVDRYDSMAPVVDSTAEEAVDEVEVEGIETL